MIEGDKTTIYQRKLGSQVLLGVFGDAKRIGYIYAYPKGVLLGMMVPSDDKPFATAVSKLYSFAKAMDNAAVSGPKTDDERHAAFMRIPYPEGDATMSMDVTDTDIMAAMRFPYGMVGGRENMQTAADNIWMLRSNAKQLTQDMIQKQGIPSKFGPLIELVLKKINIKTGPKSVLLEMSLSLDDVGDLLDAI